MRPVLEATGKQIQEVINFRENKRTSPQFNHLSAVSESISGLSWVAVEPAPSQYCREMMNAAVFYTNRVLKDFREKDKVHVEWVQAYTSVFSDLCDYIKEHHTTGVSWNPRGGAAVAAPPPPPPGGVPPPPPMVKLEPKEIKADPTAQLFQDINKGLDITSKLKKVSDDQKTHKNPSLREGPKPFSKSTSPQPKGGATAPTVKPPRMQLEGKKWFIEYQKDNKNIVLSETSMEQSVYVFKCEGSVVQVKGKINSIILDSCKKTAVVFDSLVSSLEVVNCQSCQAQVLGTVPTIAIEKTDGCMVYVSKDSLGAEIVTAKSSEMNILLPTESGEFSEHPVPEQFKTLIQNGKLVTTCTEKAGN
ncbi:Adenylate cyclase-associated CAP C-terminal [Trinorchestia longiramus]|nr:Adenylate cyclase-associated CAP C-terminal [Trinorchestia longiramus]